MTISKTRGSGGAAALLLCLAAAAALIGVTAFLLFSHGPGPEETPESGGGAATAGAAAGGFVAGEADRPGERKRVGEAGHGERVAIAGSLSLDGAPLSGVTIEAFSDYVEPIPPTLAALIRSSPITYGPAGSGLKELLEDADRPPPEPASRCRTGADGSFRITLAATRSVFFSLDHDFLFLPRDQAGPHYWFEGAKGPELPSFDGGLKAELGGLVRGTVKDPDGLPAGGVTVELLRSTGQGRNRRMGGGFFGGGGGGNPVSRMAVTGEEGTYSLRAVPQGEGYFLVARCPSFAPARSKPFTSVPGQVAAIDLRLREGDAVTVLVRDPGGAPLEGADVFLQKKMDAETSSAFGAMSGFLRMAGGAAAGRGRTGPEGTFRFTNLEPGEYTVRASYPGMREASTENPLVLEEGGGGVSAELVLGYGDAISGRVLDDEGRPVAGARIEARPRFGGRGFNFRALQGTLAGGPSSRKEARSDPGGSFTITGLEAGTAYDLDAEADGFAPKRKSGVKAGGAPEEIVMERTGQIEGRVVAKATSTPVTAFSVRIVPSGRGNAADLRGGPGGGFGRRGGPPGRGGRGPGGGGRTVPPSRGGGRFPGGSSPVGERISQTMREIFRESFSRPPRATDREEKIADTSGRFFLDHILPGDYRLLVSAEGFAPGVTEKLAVEKGTPLKGVVVPLERGAAISGRVRAPEGPVEDALVSIEAAGEENVAPELALALESIDPTRTDLEGSFRLEGLPGGSVKLRASHPDHPEAVTGLLKLPAGGELTGVFVEMPAGGAVTGTALDRQGLPLRSGQVICFNGRDWRSMRRTRTDGKGRFSFKGLGAGDYTVRLAGGGGFPFSRGEGSDSVTVSLGPGENKEILLREAPLDGAVVRGLVTDGPSAVNNGFLAVTPASGGRPRTTMIESDGSFSVEGVSPGSNRFMIRYSDGEGLETTTLTFDIPDLPEVFLDIAVPGGAIGGFVRDASTGMPLEGVRVTLLPAGEGGAAQGGRGGRGGRGFGRWGSNSTAFTGKDGAFSFKKLAQGTYDVEARPPRGAGATPGYRSATVPGIVLAEGRRIEGMLIALAAGGGIRVHASTTSNEPVRGALVTATRRPDGAADSGGKAGARGGGSGAAPPRPETVRGRTNDDGETLLRGMEPGLWSVNVAAGGMGEEVVDAVQVREGRIEEVHVVLETGFDVSVRLKDENNLAVTNARITLRDSHGKSFGAPSSRGRFGGGAGSEPGLYPLGSLAAGTYTLTARWSEGTGTATFSVSGSGTITLSLKKVR